LAASGAGCEDVRWYEGKSGFCKPDYKPGVQDNVDAEIFDQGMMVDNEKNGCS
jgi:hypothetical protein